MNNRIKKISEEAWEWTNSQDWSEDSDDYLTEFSEAFENKFAELVVKECTDVIMNGSFLHDQAPTAKFAREVTEAIKRHFK